MGCQRKQAGEHDLVRSLPLFSMPHLRVKSDELAAASHGAGFGSRAGAPGVRGLVGVGKSSCVCGERRSGMIGAGLVSLS